MWTIICHIMVILYVSIATAVGTPPLPGASEHSLSANPSSNTSTVILSETELYDGRSWQAVSWIDATSGEPAPSPADYPDPSPGCAWISDWKIVTGPTKDDFGWEYRTNRKRKRTWIRTYEIYAHDEDVAKSSRKPIQPSVSTPSTHALTPRPKTKVSALNRLSQSVRDSYNFKGFGLTLYKSLVFRQSFGLALRVPVTFNFNLWEEHPSLPSIGASVAVYHPWVVCFFLNASLRMEVIQWAMTTSVGTIIYAVFWLIWTLLLRGLVVAGSALVFPFTRRLYQPTFPLAKPNWHGPDFSRSVEERLGISWSWRLSQARGYEFRVGYWHYFAHSLVALLKAYNVQRIPNWIVRRVAAIGTSISAPLPDEPFITANSLLSLSGIYFKTQNREIIKEAKIEDTVTAALKQPIAVAMQETDAAENEKIDLSSKSITRARLTTSPGKAKSYVRS